MNMLIIIGIFALTFDTVVEGEAYLRLIQEHGFYDDTNGVCFDVIRIDIGYDEKPHEEDGRTGPWAMVHVFEKKKEEE